MHLYLFIVGLVGQSKLESYRGDLDAAKQAFCKKWVWHGGLVCSSGRW